MKFTDGYWMTKPEYEVSPALQVYRARKTESSLELLCATRPIRHRGDTLNHTMLTVTFTAPAENIIRVTAEHFRGGRGKSPDLELTETPAVPRISENDNSWCFASGDLCAVIGSGEDNFGISYYGKGKPLTGSREKGLAYVRRKTDGQVYMK